METTTIGDTKTYEGTWDEILKLAPEFNGHRLRVKILPDAVQPVVELKPTGRYAARMERDLANARESTPEEIEQEEREVKELIRNLNETRRRGGAEPISLDE